MKNNDLVRDVETLLDELNNSSQYWKMSVVLRMVDELSKMERLLHPEYYWTEGLRDKYVQR